MNHYIAMAQYNQWMNQNLYAICAEIPDAKRNEDLGAFFKSIHGTLNHILVGDRIWLGRLVKFSIPNLTNCGKSAIVLMKRFLLGYNSFLLNGSKLPSLTPPPQHLLEL
jgi:hypothetical protein